MMNRLLMTTAAASLLALGSAAYAQNATDSGTTQPAQPPVVTPEPPANAPAGNNASGGDSNAASGVISGSQPAPTADAAPASPPPSDAVISAQSDGQLRADQLIGMTVYNDQGEKVGTVHDIILDKDGKASGVVLNVGGVLGIGAKSVGLTWKEIDVKPEQQAVQISYSKEQLKAAPDFKTTDQINAEMNAQTPPASTGGGMGNAPAPATQPQTTNP